MNIEKPNINDVVTEVYYDIVPTKSAKIYKDRIHWICSQVKGTNILDVGCSQGIVSILLARESLNVLGIDVNKDSIDFAKVFFSSESSETLDNVTFECGNFLLMDFQEQLYDTIICSEVLEHLTMPERMVSKIDSVLSADGTVIFTVPFGINKAFDHKKTYYVHDLIEIIDPVLRIDHFKFFERWIGVVCKKRFNNNSSHFHIDSTLVKQMEKNFILTENDYLNTIGRKNDIIESMKKKQGILEKSSNNDSLTHNYEHDLKLKNEKIDDLEHEIDNMSSRLRGNEETIKNNNILLNELEEKINDLEYTICEKTKNIDKLLKEETILRDELHKNKAELAKSIKSELSILNKYKIIVNKHNRIAKIYNDLKNSKLGKIQCAYWEFRSKRG